MLNEIDILKDVSMRLSQKHIAFMLTGSMAMNYYAQPRMTRDLDFIISLTQGSAEDITKMFKDDYYISEEGVTQALKHMSMFNVIHNESIIKVDFIIQKKTEYRLLEFKRRKKIKIDDFYTFIVSREDLIISKLAWGQDSCSEIQKRDVLNLMGTDVDRCYLDLWISKLGLDKYYQEVIGE